MPYDFIEKAEQINEKYRQKTLEDVAKLEEDIRADERAKIEAERKQEENDPFNKILAKYKK